MYLRPATNRQDHYPPLLLHTKNAPNWFKSSFSINALGFMELFGTFLYGHMSYPYVGKGGKVNVYFDKLYIRY